MNLTYSVSAYSVGLLSERLDRIGLLSSGLFGVVESRYDFDNLMIEQIN